MMPGLLSDYYMPAYGRIGRLMQLVTNHETNYHQALGGQNEQPKPGDWTMTEQDRQDMTDQKDEKDTYTSKNKNS